MSNNKDTKAATGLSEALAESIKKFEAFKTDPKYQSEMEQNAVIVTLRELKDLSVYDESMQQEIEQLKATEKETLLNYKKDLETLGKAEARLSELEGLLREAKKVIGMSLAEISNVNRKELFNRIASALSGTEKEKI